MHVVKLEQVFQLHCTCDWSAVNTWAAPTAFAGCKATPAQPPGFAGALQGAWGALTSAMACAHAPGAADGPSYAAQEALSGRAIGLGSAGAGWAPADFARLAWPSGFLGPPTTTSPAGAKAPLFHDNANMFLTGNWKRIDTA